MEERNRPVIRFARKAPVTYIIIRPTGALLNAVKKTRTPEVQELINGGPDKKKAVSNACRRFDRYKALTKLVEDNSIIVAERKQRNIKRNTGRWNRYTIFVRNGRRTKFDFFLTAIRLNFDFV